MLSRLYPLRGLPRQGQLWSWISFDVANQSFTLIVNTLLFSIFFQQVVVQDPARDDLLWALTYATSMMLVVLASPIAGAIADDRAWKKRALLITGFLCAAFTCGLALIGPGQFWLAVLLYIPANFMFSIGENFLSSFLPELSNRENFGRVSGFSWACSYSAALLLLLLTAGGMLAFGWKSPDDWRPVFVFAGLWFFAFAIPTLLFLRERPAPADRPRTPLLRAGFHRLADSVGHARRFRDVALLFAASLFYGTGMSVIIMFASILAKEFGFDDIQLVLFVAVITVSGVLGTLLPTFYQDRLGHKRTTLLLLGVWIVTTAGFAAFAWLRAHAADPAAFPTWPLWLVGNLIGFGLGSLGSANRAFVGYLTPATRSAEFFGLWGLVFKLAAVFTIPFGFAKDAWGTPAALLVLLGFLAVGGVLTLFIDEQRGLAAARAEDERLGEGEGSQRSETN
jgi:UMF1 family MFS transporter